MTFINSLIAAGYVLDKEMSSNFEESCYIRTDEDGLTHVYQVGENVSEWTYLKMDEFHILLEVTFDPESDSIFSLIP